MCTVTWTQHADGFDLFCNRDERHTRRLAAPPDVRMRNGVRYIAPADGDFGGTWITVNEFGMAVCLLNAYEDERDTGREDYTSRGLLVAALADARDESELTARLGATRLDAFRPFTLVVVEPDVPAVVLRWDGEHCRVVAVGNVSAPLVSSSWQYERVHATRTRLLAEMVRERGALDTETLEAFHRTHVPARGPESVCMHRDDTETVSLSVVSVRPDVVEFRYEAGAPCESIVCETVVLERAVARGSNSPMTRREPAAAAPRCEG